MTTQVLDARAVLAEQALAATRGVDGRTYRPMLTGAARQLVVSELTRCYEAGATIRDLVEEYALPFGSVQTYLGEGGAAMRPRGDTRRLTSY